MEEKKTCPYCGEEILATAKKCKHCGEMLEKEPSGVTKFFDTAGVAINRWLDFSGVSDGNEVKSIFYFCFLIFFIFCLTGGLLGNDFYEYVLHRPLSLLLLAIIALRYCLIPLLASVWRYVFVSSYKEAKAEVEADTKDDEDDVE